VIGSHCVVASELLLPNCCGLEVKLHTKLQGKIVGEEDYRIFSASQDNTLRLWDPVSLECLCVYEPHLSEVSTCTFFEAWNMLISGHDAGEIVLWNMATGSQRTLYQHTNSVSCMEMALLAVCHIQIP
jgi:WD40 repeat protein